MVIVRTPLRVSFFGGGTDHPTWFEKNPGCVLSTTINKYIYLQMRRLPSIFDFNHRVVWSKVEQCVDLNDIEHPVVREVLRHYCDEDNRRFEVVYNADLPSRSGLGSSSAFTVAFLQALAVQKGQIMTKKDLAREAIRVEQDLLKEPVGSQDQIAVAYGGVNRIDFLPGGEFQVTPLPLSSTRREEFESHIMMFFTRFTRSASKIEETKVKNFDAKRKQLERMAEMVPEAQDVILNSKTPIEEVGKLLHEGWMLKRELSGSVSSPAIDEAYDAAIAAGASGGKLLGAGGGGFLLFIVRPSLQPAVRAALSGLVEVPIKFEREGSQVVLFDPDLTSNYR
jgi:D-glycero-alpha-D-manno-heptose-7-phosphate kinase